MFLCHAATLVPYVDFTGVISSSSGFHLLLRPYQTTSEGTEQGTGTARKKEKAVAAGERAVKKQKTREGSTGTVGCRHLLVKHRESRNPSSWKAVRHLLFPRLLSDLLALASSSLLFEPVSRMPCKAYVGTLLSVFCLCFYLSVCLCVPSHRCGRNV